MTTNLSISIVCSTKEKSKLEFTGRSYKNYDCLSFQNNLLAKDWNLFYTTEDVNLAWDIMLTNIMSTIDNMCPLKKYKVAKAKEPWVTNEILEMIKDKDRLLRRAKYKNTENDWALARNAIHNTNYQIRRAKANFIQDILEIHQDSKKILKNIKDVLPNGNNSQTNKISSKDQNHNFIQNDKETANILNDYFTTIGPSLASNMTDPWLYNGHIFYLTY